MASVTLYEPQIYDIIELMKESYVYIITNRRNGTLYIGASTDLIRRIFEHKQKFVDGFSKQHDLKHLVYFESHPDIQSACLREKQMKTWKRAWKIRLIEEKNPYWRDLYEDLI